MREPRTTLAKGRSPETLGYGEFYGVFERRHDLPQFSLALIAPGDLWRSARKHGHEAAHILYVVSGDYIVSSDETSRIVSQRSALFVPAGTTHRNHPATPMTKVLTISISSAQIEQAFDHVRLPGSESIFRGDDVTFLAGRVELELSRWDSVSPLAATGLCLELLGALGRSAVNEPTAPRWLRAARALIHDRADEAISVAEIAVEVGVHAIHLSRTFRRFYHCTPGDYLRRCRVERASVRLRESTDTIAQVAVDAGFSDQSHMTKVFRRQMGTTPARFRLSVRRKV